MLSTPLVVGTSLVYLGGLFAVAAWANRRAAAGRSVVDNAWVYGLSMAVYCTAWTYYGSVGRAAASGVWFLPIYLGPTLAMVLALSVLRKMIRIARRHRITSIADFVASRYGKSPLLAGLVTVITVVGIVPYIALQLKAISTGFALMSPSGDGAAGAGPWWSDGTLHAALLLAGFTMMFGTRQIDGTERHEGMVAAIAFESVVKLLAFVAVGVFVTWGLFDGPRDLFARVAAVPALRERLSPAGAGSFGYAQWFALTLLSMLSVVFLPRQFQVIVVENVDERHLARAAWLFPAYMLVINLFVLPIAFGGLLLAGGDATGADAFVLSLPLAHGADTLALVAFVGGLSAATGMIIVEAIAVSTMVCNDLVMPVLLRGGRLAHGHDLTRWLRVVRRAAIVLVLLGGYLYFHFAGEAYALVSIGLISFAAVAQFAPAALGGMYWKGGTRAGALAGLVVGFGLWVYTLMLPSIARSGWFPAEFVEHGPLGIALLRPEALFGLAGLDGLTHSLFWSLLANVGAYVGVSLWRAPSAAEASQAALFVELSDQGDAGPAFWRGQAHVSDLLPLAGRFLGPARARALFEAHAERIGAARVEDIRPDAGFVRHVETQLAGVIGSASARLLVESVVQEEPLAIDDVMRMLDEASQVRAYSRALEAQSASLRGATEELRAANEQLKSLDRLKDDFMSSVTHELRTPLTSIRALAELMADDPEMEPGQRQRFVRIVVVETERLSRLVNQVLDLAKIESGQADWQAAEVDVAGLVRQAADSLAQLLQEQGTVIELDLAGGLPPLRADADRLTQVLLNLLGNAARAVPRSGGRIVVRLRGEAAGLRLTVQDNGHGVAPAERARLFERFQQAGDPARRAGGTGLGLPISRRIVEHFGGRIVLADDGAEGACFVVTLPWAVSGAASARPGRP
ncbi:MAG: ATP-binding protein [Rubrivivax sp.]